MSSPLVRGQVTYQITSSAAISSTLTTTSIFFSLHIDSVIHLTLSMSRTNKLAPEANRILFVKNLPYNVDTPTLFDLFGKHGPIRQIRAGTTNNTKGTAYVVYEDVMDAKNACDRLNGFNFMNRYLVVLYHQPEKMKVTTATEDIAARQENLEKMKQEHGID